MPNLPWTRPHRLALSLCAAAVCIATATVTDPVMAAPAYRYTPLLSLGGPQGSGIGWAINQQGQVAGGSNAPGELGYVPTLWTAQGTPVGLGFLSDRPGLSVAYGLNDRGQAVGSDIFDRAIVWNGTQATALPSLNGLSAQAAAINNAGQIVGWSMSPDTFGFHATLWQDGQPTHLRSLGGPNSFANDINESGLVAGSAESATRTEATIWRDGVVHGLGTWYGQHSFAQGLNDLGHVVGADMDPQGASHAFIWNGSAMSLLAPLAARSRRSAACSTSSACAGR